MHQNLGRPPEDQVCWEIKEHSCRKMTDGVEERDGRRFAKPAKEASFFVLRVRKENGRLWVVAGLLLFLAVRLGGSCGVG